MNRKDRDTFDDLFHSKFQNFEVETEGDDWTLIADRLPQKRVSFRQYLYYIAAAAILLLLFLVGGLYVSSPIEEKMVDVNQTELPIIQSNDTIKQESYQSLDAIAMVSKVPVTTKLKILRKISPVEKQVESFNVKDVSVEPQIVQEDESDPIQIDEADFVKEDFPKQKVEEVPVTKKKKMKRWGFGMGGGSVSAGSSNSFNPSFLKSEFASGANLLRVNSSYFSEQSNKADIRHKIPFSIGMGVSYRLNERFSLLSGLNYSFLVSEWNVNAVYRDEVKQKLHFVGIPLSLSCKIAKWQDFQFYTTVGGMVEMNVAGKLCSKIYAGNDLISESTESLRMKDLLWSLNACVGVDYPLLHFLSLYAEAGVNYYFDNGSAIETIRSEKPFNVKLHAGFRFGF